ncbi:MAG TPA: hypothetical protein VLJ59_08545 [Mycobacteriales bacterium]|nr:hypothetical protein [Mycobacteriales bacterium]
MSHGEATREVELLSPDAMRSTPTVYLFVPLTQQMANIRRWNRERGWGFTAAELSAVDLTPAYYADPLVVDVIAVYLPDGNGMDGVRRTCHELWTVAAGRQGSSWSWDWFMDRWKGHPKPVRLLAGIEHRPGVRRVTLDLAAHATPGSYLRPDRVRGKNSAHAEVLAAAAHFPKWIRAMDGTTVPFTFLAGYQVTLPERSVQHRLPFLSWSGFRRTLSLTADFAYHGHLGWASPVVRTAAAPA